MVIKTKVNKTYNYILRLGIVFFTYGFIYKQIFHKKDIYALFSQLEKSVESSYFIILLIVVFTLMFVNWMVESIKWRYLILKIENISIIKSLEAVFTGISISAFTPNRIGEYFGRVFILDRANPWKAILVTIIGSMSQLLTTLILGSIGLLLFINTYKSFIINFFYINQQFFMWLYSGAIILTLFVDVFLLLLFLNVPVVTDYVNKLVKKRWRRIRSYISVLGEYQSRELLKVIMMSFTRYMIFTAQFYLLLRMFEVNIPYYHAMIIISMVYFVITVIPTVALTELGIRGSVSIYFLGLYFDKFQTLNDAVKLGIVSASTGLWLINLAIPALMGTIFVFRLKFFRKIS